MKRTNSPADALNRNKIIVNVGDGLPDIELPLDGNFGGGKGDKGEGIPEGGGPLQVVRKTAAGTTTEWATLTPGTVGLSNVDNTADLEKPLSQPQAQALTNKADLVDGRVPESQLPEITPVTDSTIAPLINGATTGAAIDARINTQVAPQVQKITADFIAGDRAVADAAAAAVNAAPKIVQLETVTIPQALTDAKSYADTEVGKDRTRLGGLERDKWFRGDITAGGEVDSLRGTGSRGRYAINSTSVAGLPGPWLGNLDVLPNSADGRTIQEFTRSGSGPTVRLSRAFSGGTWGPWGSASWFAGLLGAGVDWDTLKAPALYSIQFTNHPHQAAPVIGALEVLPSSGNVIQRFTEGEAPHYLWSRKFNGAVWSEFSRGGGSAGTPPPATTGGFGAPARGPLQASTSVVTPKSSSQIMGAMSKDRTRGWNQNTSALSETRDDGLTWVQVNDKDGVNVFAGATIESVLELDNQELLVTCQRGATRRREVWVSSNMREPSSRTFVRTMEARAPYVKFTSAWSMSTHGNIVLLNEYGPKTPTWDGQPVEAGENARYTYLSLDGGLTWSTVFDLNAYLTETQKRPGVEGQHLHGVAWDEYWDRIWVTFGDNLAGAGSNGIVYSDDLGETWKTAHFYTGVNPPHQVVTVQPMPKCVLFYGDMGPDVVRIDRSEGKWKVGGYATPVAFDSTAPGKHLCQGSMRVKRTGDDGPAVAVFSSEGASAPSFAVATLDGYAFTEVWRDSVNNPSGMGARSIVGPTLRGKVIIGSNDQKVSGMWSEVTAVAPGY